MNDDNGRPRRRPQPDGPRRAARQSDPWLFTIVAAVIVVVGGWFLGQGLAHLISPKQNEDATVASAPTAAAAVSPSASPAAAPSAAPPASTAPHPTPRPTPVPAPSKKPVRAVAAMPTLTPSPVPAATAAPSPSPVPVKTTPAPHYGAAPAAPPAVHKRPRATPSPAPPPVAERTPAPVSPAENAGAQTVRAYIDAVRRGDPQAAASYLGNGEPDEDFIDPSTSIRSLTSSQNADGSYTVHATLATSRGTYVETFVVAGNAGSAKILEKSAVKP